jgi:hypothetical protein
MTSKVLTLLQEQVLTALFTHGLVDSGSYLTGGTALFESMPSYNDAIGAESKFGV